MILESPMKDLIRDYFKTKPVVKAYLFGSYARGQAEYTAMALRTAKNSIIIGSMTAGADGNISSFNLVGGVNTAISGVGVYYPNGKETQRIGIVPDIEIKPTIKGVIEGRDELLEKAIELINQ
jgi:C-terminal processing protease CtpA/Prc